MKGNQKRARGMTLIELIIAITIASVIMTAITTAILAGISAYTYNTQVNSLNHAGRVVLYRMLKQVRTAKAADIGWRSLKIYPSDETSGVDSYAYRLRDNVLYYDVTKDGGPTTYTLLGTEDEFTVLDFDIERAQEVSDGVWTTTQIKVTLKLQCGEETVTLTASGGLRVNQGY